MSGHNKWSSIKHKKGKADAKRGKIFSKLLREIQVAAKIGGGDPDHNPRLRAVIDKARAENMPKDNIANAIKKGTGELATGESFEETLYEGYGTKGVAVMVHALTDNKRRTSAEVRHVFSRYGGNMGESGCVSWIFSEKGDFIFNKNDVDADELMEIALEAGAADIEETDDIIEVTTEPKDYISVKEIFDEKGLKYQSAELTMIPQTTVTLTGNDVHKMLRLMEAFDDLDDVDGVYANFDISMEDMENFSDE